MATPTSSSSSSSSSIFFFFVTLFLTSLTSHGHSTPKTLTHKALFVFGDSLFDPGNNQYLSNSTLNRPATTLPYGETYFKHPTGRLSDGRIVPDFIAQFAKLPILGPYLEPGAHDFTNGTNFASAGAGVLDETHPGTISLRTQLSHFKDVKKMLAEKMGSEETEKLLRRSVYLFSIGGNDYFSYFSSNPSATQNDKRQYVATVVSNLTNVLKELYAMGGRKIAFQNAGALGCLPGSIASNQNKKGGSVCGEGLSSLARLHNMALARAMKKMATHLPGFKHAIFDYYHSIEDRVLNPTKYGFKKGTVACYSQGKGGSNPGDYVWFDGAHTTEKANFELAQLLWSGAPNVTGPYNMMQLFGDH